MSEPAARYDITDHADATEPDLTAYQAGVVELMEGPFPGPGIQMPGTDLAPVVTLAGDALATTVRVHVLTEEIRGMQYQHAMTYVEIGARLVELKQIAEPGQWLDALDSLGFAPRTAQAYMLVALKVAKLPALRSVAANSISKVLAIIQSTTDEELRDIEAGNGPITLDEIDHLSVRKLKSRCRELTESTAKLIKRATATLEKERDDLIEERDKLAALTGDTLDSLRRAIGLLDDHLSGACTTLNGIYDQLDVIPRSQFEHPKMQILVEHLEATVGRLATTGNNLWVRWGDRVGYLGSKDEDPEPLD